MITTFSKYIIEYIKRDFELNIISVSQDEFDYLFKVIKDVFDIFISDVISKYPRININDLSGDDLVKLVQSDCTLIACLLYRIEREIFLKDASSPVLPALANTMRTRTGIELYYSTSIGRGLNLQHGSGIVVGPRYTIGDNFVIHQGVTLGQRKSPLEKMTIGHNVTIFAGAKILGNITIGDNVRIAANAVLIHDVPEGSTYGGIPAAKLN